jgi:hypothetical protein
MSNPESDVDITRYIRYVEEARQNAEATRELVDILSPWGLRRYLKGYAFSIWPYSAIMAELCPTCGMDMDIGRDMAVLCNHGEGEA